MTIDLDKFLEHHGIKGMQWGVRKGNLSEVSNETNRVAQKDAWEFARAKLFFGPDADARRKSINSRVTEKKSTDPAYAKAFDYHLGNQDMSKHVSKARSELDQYGKKVEEFLSKKLEEEAPPTGVIAASAVSPEESMTSVKAFVDSDKVKIAKQYLSDLLANNQ